ncbi:monocarboxylate transporter 13-like [Saccoglossus kowalevskii]|uniref:Monocarboxylate transporter 12-like n=1 Tax=Saccoglossus kowalevskii TaxID=10224 RepID=A0ABM0M8T6_SACKO|nr:PREDICTED: monocarboxylate transporter 12-like [Saccoglossus kowalevskii]
MDVGKPQPENGRKLKLSAINVPPDGGWGLVVVAAAHVSLLLSIGSLTAFGPFINKLKDYFDDTTSSVAGISGTAIFVTYAIGPIASALNNKIGCRLVVFIGGLVASIGLVLSFLATTTIHLYFTYGIISGIGYGLAMTPTMAITASYFKRYYALANGIVFTGVGIGWIALPPLYQTGIQVFGWRGSILILAAVTSNICVCACVFRPPPMRIVSVSKNSLMDIDNDVQLYTTDPLLEHARDTKKIYQKINDTSIKNSNRCCQFMTGIFNPKLFRDPLFLLQMLVFFIFGLGFYPTILLLVPRAVSYGIPYPWPTVVLTAWGVTSVIGRATHGMIVDRKILTSWQAAGLALIVCGLLNIFSFPATTFLGLAILYSVFGFANGVQHPIAVVAIKDFVGVSKFPEALGFCNMCLGISGLIGPPVAGSVYDITGNYYNSYLFAGCLLFAGGVLELVGPICLHKFYGIIPDCKQNVIETANETDNNKTKVVADADQDFDDSV